MSSKKFFLIIPVIFLTLSCTRVLADRETTDCPDGIADKGIVDVAKNLFNESRRKMKSSMSEEGHRGLYYGEVDPYWQSSETRRFSSGRQILIVPIRIDSQLQVIQKELDADKYVLMSCPSYLIMSIDESKRVYSSYVITQIPTNEYSRSHKQCRMEFDSYGIPLDYSGIVLCSSLDGRLYGARTYNDGILTSRVWFPSKKTEPEWKDAVYQYLLMIQGVRKSGLKSLSQNSKGSLTDDEPYFDSETGTWYTSFAEYWQVLNGGCDSEITEEDGGDLPDEGNIGDEERYGWNLGGGSDGMDGTNGDPNNWSHFINDFEFFGVLEPSICIAEVLPSNYDEISDFDGLSGHDDEFDNGDPVQCDDEYWLVMGDDPLGNDSTNDVAEHLAIPHTDKTPNIYGDAKCAEQLKGAIERYIQRSPILAELISRIDMSNVNVKIFPYQSGKDIYESSPAYLKQADGTMTYLSTTINLCVSGNDYEYPNQIFHEFVHALQYQTDPGWSKGDCEFEAWVFCGVMQWNNAIYFYLSDTDLGTLNGYFDNPTDAKNSGVVEFLNRNEYISSDYPITILDYNEKLSHIMDLLNELKNF